MTTRFSQKVYAIVGRIPRGRVASYGMIAALTGNPRAAQAVGWVMHRMDSMSSEQHAHYPWWRVINVRGMISTTCQKHTAGLQVHLLEKESIVVTHRSDGTRWVDLKKYLWHPEK